MKTILVVADGWGIAPSGPGNYIEAAKTPVMDRLMTDNPCTEDQAAGNAVGLPEGAQGNSEVGHLHLGAGRIVWQMYEKINRAVQAGELATMPLLKQTMESVKEKGDLHLMGLCSDEGVHAHTEHLLALLQLAKKWGIPRVFIHFWADGRDVAEKSAQTYVEQIEAAGGVIATVVGRYYAMDRDTNWDRTQVAYDLLTQGKGHRVTSATVAVTEAYARGDKTDYYIEPTVIVDDHDQPLALIKDGDAVICFNFRTDRPRQLCHALTDASFEHFPRTAVPKIKLVTFTAYDPAFAAGALFTEEKILNNLGQVLAANKLKQLRLAETEKYAHVTYFFNSQVEAPNEGEDRIMIPSLKVPSYDEAPKMSAEKIASTAVEQIGSQKYDFILINFANLDLVGHSAVKEAIVTAVETVDACIGQVVAAAQANGYAVIVTGDHGSAEDKLYPDGTPKPSHSLNRVPLVIVGSDIKNLRPGGQQDVAPTILALMGLPQPVEMTGVNLAV